MKTALAAIVSVYLLILTGCTETVQTNTTTQGTPFTMQEIDTQSRVISVASDPLSIFTAKDDSSRTEAGLTFKYGHRAHPDDVKSLIIFGPGDKGNGKVYRIFGTQKVENAEEIVLRGECRLGDSKVKNSCFFSIEQGYLSPKTQVVGITINNRTPILLSASNITQTIYFPVTTDQLNFNIGAR